MEQKIFIHIPKNGGIAIGRANKNVLKVTGKSATDLLDSEYVAKAKASKGWNNPTRFGHARWRDYKSDITNKYTAFAIIRNPWSKVVSRYTYGMIRRPKAGLPVCTFEQFLEERHDLAQAPFYWHRAISGWYQQLDHVTSKQGELTCDILRFERYSNDTMKYLNLDVPLPIHNVSNGKIVGANKIVNRKDYKEFYNDTTREIVADWYKKDIDLFGFTFESPATKNIWNTEG